MITPFVPGSLPSAASTSNIHCRSFPPFTPPAPNGGRHNVLKQRAEALAEARGLFVVHYGINLDDYGDSAFLLLRSCSKRYFMLLASYCGCSFTPPTLIFCCFS